MKESDKGRQVDSLLNYWQNGERSAQFRVDGARVAEPEAREAAHLDAASADRLERLVVAAGRRSAQRDAGVRAASAPR